MPRALASLPPPDLILILVASWSLLRGVREGILWGGLGGLFLGLVSQFPLGSHILLLVVLALLISLSQGSIYRSNLLFPLGVVLIASLVYNLSLILLRWLSASLSLSPPMWGDLFISVIFPQAFWNTFLTLLIYPLLRILHLATGPARLGW